MDMYEVWLFLKLQNVGLEDCTFVIEIHIIIYTEILRRTEHYISKIHKVEAHIYNPSDP